MTHAYLSRIEARSVVFRNHQASQQEQDMGSVRRAVQDLPENIGNAVVNITEAFVDEALAVRDTSLNVVGGTVMGTASLIQHAGNLVNFGRTQRNYTYNTQLDSPQGFINNQRDESIAGFKMSNVTTGYFGCGWISVFNASLILGKEFYPEYIIRYLERRGGFTRGGRYGTNPHAIQSFFRSQGYNTHMQYLPRSVDDAIRGSQVSILAYQHGQGLGNLTKDGSHYVAVRYVNGQFELFNDDPEDSREVDSVDEFLLYEKRDLLNLITIR